MFHSLCMEEYTWEVKPHHKTEIWVQYAGYFGTKAAYCGSNLNSTACVDWTPGSLTIGVPSASAIPIL